MREHWRVEVTPDQLAVGGWMVAITNDDGVRRALYGGRREDCTGVGLAVANALLAVGCEVTR